MFVFSTNGQAIFNPSVRLSSYDWFYPQSMFMCPARGGINNHIHVKWSVKTG